MLKDVSGHILEIGDKVKMNIEVLKNGDLDGVEFTSTGENYWKYICSHPDEVYTVTDITYQYSDESIYVLDGYLADNTWAADELIYVPEAKSRYEVIKNMSLRKCVMDYVSFLLNMTLLKMILLNGLTRSNCNNKKPLPQQKGFLV